MKKRIIALVLAVVALVTALIVPISAATESTEEMQNSLLTDEQKFWIKYPFFNILPDWFNSAITVGSDSGLTVNVEQDGTINVTGQALKPSEGLISYYDILIFWSTAGVELPPVCTFALNERENRAYAYIELDNDNSKRINVTSEPVTFSPNGSKLTRVYLRIRYDDQPDNMTLRPMLNAGEIAYPFQPYSLKEEMLGEGYDRGYEVGYTNGHIVGLDKGYENGLRDGENIYYSQGVEYGYINGYESGYSTGHYEGLWEGLNQGYEQGKTEGYEMGHEQGYSEGFSTGTDYGEQQEVSKNIIGVVDSIASAPSKAIGTMLDFEIFGFKIDTLVFRIITLILVVAVIGLVFKFFLR